MITLPLENQAFPVLRILTRQSWGGAATSGGGWQIQPMLRRGPAKHGFRVLSWDRVALPEVGRAAFAVDYGLFDAAVVTTAPDLKNHEVRIQVAERPELDSDEPTGWTTAWWGTVDSVEDRMSPGASVPRGTRIYHCVDGLQRTKRWAIDHHGVTVKHLDNNFIFPGVAGTLSYNVSPSGTVVGNRHASQFDWQAAQANYHAPIGDRWSDQQAAEHALTISRPNAGEPLFRFAGATDLLAGETPWRVAERENCHDFVARVCRRERGKGLVFVDWADAADPAGPLSVFLTVRPQLAADIVWTDPIGGTVTTIQGATSRGTTTAVDLIGDHRNCAADFNLAGMGAHRFDYVETLGEPITVLATLSYLDSPTGSGINVDGITLVRGWSPKHQADYFRTFTAVKRQEAAHRPVYQLHLFNPRWPGLAGDGNGGASVPIHRIDYRCTDGGYLRTPETLTEAEKAIPENSAFTSPLEVSVREDLPLFQGYDYSATIPARVDEAAEDESPKRRKLALYVRLGANRYLDVDQTAAGSVYASVDGNGIWAVHSGDEGAGTRFFGDTALAGLGSVYSYDKLVLTVALELPHRVRMATGDPNGKRRATIRLPGVHLDVASPGAIWELDTATGSSSLGYAARRGACSGSVSGGPGLLRDDRAALATAHALACSWYLTQRRNATWALKACSALGSFATADGATVSYPTLGQVVTTIAANGQTLAIGTPITSVAYDAEAGVTRWETGWAALDLS